MGRNFGLAIMAFSVSLLFLSFLVLFHITQYYTLSNPRDLQYICDLFGIQVPARCPP